MKKISILLLATLITVSMFGQKTYWKKKFNNGTLYLSFIKNDAKFGTHIRTYFTGNDNAHIIKVKYDYASGKYKCQKRNGWSYKEYISFDEGQLVYKTVDMGRLEMTKTSRSAIPRYITEDAYFKRIYITD